MTQPAHINGKEKAVAFLLALTCSFLVFPTFFEATVESIPFWGSLFTLDPAWRATLNKIDIEQLTWGTDFTFTYGPLGYLATRIGWGQSKWHLVLYDVFVSFNFLYIFYTSSIKSSNRWLTASFIVAVSILLPVYFDTGSPVLLFAFLIFWIRQSLEHVRLLPCIMQCLIVTLAFYIKFNTGLVVIALSAAAAAYQLIFTKENKLLLISTIAAPLLLIFLFSYPLHVALPDYLVGGLNMVSGYNEIMCADVQHDGQYLCAVGLLIIALTILCIRLFAERRLGWHKNLFATLLFAGAAYIVYKQGFTRADVQHYSEFYNFIPVLILCIQDFHFTKPGYSSAVLLVLIIATNFFFVKRHQTPFSLVSEKLCKSNYISGFEHFSATSGFHLLPNQHPLPHDLAKKIGRATVDIYPWNTLLLFENGLNYQPRPAFQSYTAYTPYLENLNFDLYNSAKAPEYVLYEMQSIDNRYPVFDEPKLNQLLLKNYECIDSVGISGAPLLLLKKKQNAKKLEFKKLREYETGLQDPIRIEHDLFYELNVSYSLRGKLQTIFHRAPKLGLAVGLSDSFFHEYKTSPKLLASGIFSDHFFTTTGDLYDYMRKDRDSAGTGFKVWWYGLKADKPECFKDKIIVTVYKVN